MKRRVFYEKIKSKIAAILTAAMIFGLVPNVGVKAAEADETVIESQTEEETIVEQDAYAEAEEAEPEGVIEAEESVNASKLAAPTMEIFDMSYRTIKWKAVPNATKYQYSLVKSNGTVIISGQTTDTELFVKDGTFKKIEAGYSYSFGISAIGDGTSYSDSETTSVGDTPGVVKNTYGEIGNCNFEYHKSDKTLYITKSQTGSNMQNFSSYDSAPWYDYNGMIYNIKLGDGITSIGNNAFYQCYNVSSIDFPKSLVSIGRFAFSGCTKLEEVDLPEGFTTIEEGAFYGCSSLGSTWMPESLEIIGSYAFYGCSQNTCYVYPNSTAYSLVKGKYTWKYAYHIIHSVELYGTEKAVVGKTPSTDIVVGDETSTLTTIQWVRSLDASKIEESSDSSFTKFEKNYTYALLVEITANDGYRFEHTTTSVPKFAGDVIVDYVEFNGDVYSNSDGTRIWAYICVGKAYSPIIVNGIYVGANYYNQVLAACSITDENEGSKLEYLWEAEDERGKSSLIQSFSSANGNCLTWNNPKYYGKVTLRCEVRDVTNPYEYEYCGYTTTEVELHPFISGTCQMPDPNGNGFLIGLTSYKETEGVYCELSILDCTLYAQGKPAWVSSTGLVEMVSGDDAKYFWTTWAPQYGYYWTLFRVYDKDKKLIDEVCYGFQNI